MQDYEDNSIELDTDGPDIEVEIESTDSSDDQFSKAETTTQKRIDRLTKKMREAERREQEAVKYAQAVQQEANSLKQRVTAADSGYVTEYSNRVNTEINQAESALARAIELGDTKGSVEAQRRLTTLAIQADRAQQAKMQQDRYTQQAAAAEQAQARQPMPAQAPKRPDPKAEQWAVRNSWFGQDEAMTYAAFGIHKRLVEDEGFDPATDEYYNELDRRISGKFNTGGNNTNRRPAQTVAGASRNVSGRSGNKVRLTPSQVAIAKKLGVPLEEYAKYVKE
tara:strand:- start:765 stop:1604 length:840 start_codon:yes stop_codon:yes gene_type:complete